MHGAAAGQGGAGCWGCTGPAGGCSAVPDPTSRQAQLRRLAAPSTQQRAQHPPRRSRPWCGPWPAPWTARRWWPGSASAPPPRPPASEEGRTVATAGAGAGRWAQARAAERQASSLFSPCSQHPLAIPGRALAVLVPSSSVRTSASSAVRRSASAVDSARRAARPSRASVTAASSEARCAARPAASSASLACGRLE